VVVMVLSGLVSQSALIPYRRGWHSQRLPNGNRFRMIVRPFATSPALRPHLLGAWAFVSDRRPPTIVRS
jgi:hypothetical protein